MTTPAPAAARATISPADRVLVSEADAAVLLSVSRPTFRKYCALGYIHRVELPTGTRRNLFARDELAAFAAQLSRTSAVRPK